MGTGGTADVSDTPPDLVRMVALVAAALAGANPVLDRACEFEEYILKGRAR
jgi:hypothetical protein